MIIDVHHERGLSRADDRWGHASECRFPLFWSLYPFPLQWMILVYTLMLLGEPIFPHAWFTFVSPFILWNKKLTNTITLKDNLVFGLLMPPNNRGPRIFPIKRPRLNQVLPALMVQNFGCIAKENWNLRLKIHHWQMIGFEFGSERSTMAQIILIWFTGIVCILGAMGMVLGYRFRLSCLCYLVAYWYVFLLDKSHWNNHSYLFGLIATQLTLSGAHRCWYKPTFFVHIKTLLI